MDLFGNQDFPQGHSTLLMRNVSGTTEFRVMQAQLNNAFTIEAMNDIVNFVHSVLGQCNICDIDSPDRILKDMYIPEHGLKYKKDYERYLAGFFCCKENFSAFFSMLDKPTQAMWEYLYIHDYVSPEELDGKTGKKWFKIQKRHSYWNDGADALSYACCIARVDQQGYYSSAKTYIYLKDLFRDLYSKYIFADAFHDKITSSGSDSLPEGTIWQTYTNENCVGSQIQVIVQLNQQNAIEFADKKMTAAEIKKIDRQLNVPEFFPDSKDNSHRILAASLAIPILSSLLTDYKDSLTEYHKVLKFIFSKYSMRYVLFDMLSHLKGLKRYDILEETYYDEHEKLLQTALKALKTGKWYSLEEVQMKMYSSLDNHDEYMSVFTVGTTYSNNISKSDGTVLSPDDFYDYVQCPVTCGYLALYAACGLLEVAYTDSEGIGAYSFIRYVRPTPLGAYAFGITTSYEAEGVHKPIEYFEAEPDRLIIFCRQIDGKNPYEGLLTSIAEKISANRWRVTPKTWLNCCENVNDLIKKEDFVKTNICTEPSETWQAFFAQMTGRCNPLRVPAMHYVVRQLDPSNKELQQLFLTDSYLRKHSLRGENFTILIENKFMKKVEEKLREYGYLI